MKNAVTGRDFACLGDNTHGGVRLAPLGDTTTCSTALHKAT
ncbi:hypothetical protein [Paraburkholderia sp. J63]|nr:hypothetical protein [Paraburkholderia sp. J63]